MSKRIGNPRVYWIRLEMASHQKPDAAHAEALSVLHDPELIQLVDAEMDIYAKPTLVLVHYGLGGWILTGWTAKTEDLFSQDWYEHTTIKEDMEE